jgi:hypothetical protein
LNALFVPGGKSDRLATLAQRNNLCSCIDEDRYFSPLMYRSTSR